MENDLEALRRAAKPGARDLVAGGNGNEALQGEHRRFANSTLGWEIAAAIHCFTNSGQGGNYWFSRWKLGQGGRISEAIGIGERLGLWNKNPDKEYWIHNHLTWKFVNTALALQAEWVASDEKKLTQHDYDLHNWHRSEKLSQSQPERAEGSGPG